MARDAKGSGPQVKETDYLATSDGPEEDTGIFYKRTPVSGMREVRLETRRPKTPRVRRRDAEPKWLKRPATETVDSPGVSADQQRLYLVWAVAFLSLLALILMGVLAFLWAPKPAVAVQPEPVENHDGVRVKKDLR